MPTGCSGRKGYGSRFSGRIADVQLSGAERVPYLGGSAERTPDSDSGLRREIHAAVEVAYGHARSSKKAFR